MSQAQLEDAVITQLNADTGAGTFYAALSGRKIGRASCRERV